ncbi:MAG TPA: hypothetical protein VD971_11625 [Phycisphaerales bacterium]|nr:hypothetical protein [Phycisphaerales bacterium]
MTKTFTICALSCVGLAASAASASLIRPDSATATSTFSGLYDIGNTIDGSGLPANFTPADAHATYTTNNHWTTANGDTIGESATFYFNTPQTLGVFHMWNHRSNGIAANPHYEVTLFDLILRDSASNVLLSLTNVVAQPDVAVAQNFSFAQTANVSSVQLVVRATANNNSSPYTGLAEVAFSVPAPGAAALLALAGLTAARRRR